MVPDEIERHLGAASVREIEQSVMIALKSIERKPEAGEGVRALQELLLHLLSSAIMCGPLPNQSAEAAADRLVAIVQSALALREGDAARQTTISSR